MRYTFALLLVGCVAAPPAPPPKPFPDTVVLTPTPQAVPAALVRFPGYNESLKVHNPTPANNDSLARGYTLFQQHCAACHAQDLSGEVTPGQPALHDLRRTDSYKLGVTDQALYRTIKFGIPGTAMGRNNLGPLQVFDLVNFLRSRHKA
ncbi:c-type cytochrome [bacterium]|nr:c-type cytochrome [bacterium]